jgi:hypothetical protein
LQNIAEYINTAKGRLLFNAYLENNSGLTPALRDTLLDDIIESFTSNKILMKDNDFYRIVDEIVNTFQNERKVKIGCGFLNYLDLMY